MMMEENQKVAKNSSSSRIESIKHYCRVCTSNPKTKRTHPEENIRIFSRTGLLSILQKFLHLEVSEDDPLPKTICKKCFEKLMAIEYLQIVAKRSESLFKDFLANRCPKPSAKTQSSTKTDFNIKPAPINIEKKPEEVIVDVSMSDPLTKDIQKKLQVAQSKRDSIGLAFSPHYISKNAVTSSPLNQVPVTIVHRMPKKRKITPSPLEKNQIVQIPHPHPSLQPQKTSTTTVTLENPPKNQFCLLKPKANPTSPLRHISEAPSIPQNVEIHPVVSGNPQVMGHGMPLGSIIKDVDLLKLILKALKWPFNSQTLDLQIERLKNTNFNDIIVDPNLLQDTDLIQILGPLIAPLPVTMRQQTYHITIPPETLETPPTTMSYKLPAETSVQIITVPATEKESSHGKDRPTKRHNKSSSMRKKSSLVPRPRLSSQVIVVSDDSEDNRPLQIAATNDDIPNFGVQLDPAVYPGVGENSNSNEAMLATLNRQREAMMRMHRSKRKQSLNCVKNVEMVDDIMIVDEGFHVDGAYPEVLQSNKNLEIDDMLPVASTSQRKSAPNKTFAPFESVKSDIAFPQIKTQPTPRSKSLTSMKPVRCLTEHLKPEKVPPIHGFANLKEDSRLPPLKRVKLLPKSAGQIQVKEASKLVYMSKNTTVADADSTTKIVTKETKSPKPTKPLWNFGKISKAKRAAQANRCESIEQRSSSVKNQGTEKNEKSDKDVIVVLDGMEDECHEKQKKAPEVVAISKKKKNLKNTTPTRSEKRKNDYKVLATFDVSDEEMEPLQVSDTSAKHSVEEKTTPPVEEEASSKTATTEPPAADCLVEAVEIVDNLPNVAAKESNPTEIDPLAENDNDTNPINVPEIAIKAENNESIDIKKEDLESAYEGQAVKLEPTTKNASKMTIKSEIAKSTRSSGKRKAIQKEEEPPIEITNFRPARKSKTLSKYYKGPPLSGTPGRCMRSRT